MFLKNSGYKPRQASQSAGSDATDAKEVRQPVQTTNVQSAQPENNAAAGRRRSSGQYTGLNNYKRNSIDQERRTSIQDQSAHSGVLGQMWTNFTKGNK